MASLTPITGSLGTARALHLVRRATFGASRAEIDAIATKTAAQAVAELLSSFAIPPAPLNTSTGITWRSTGEISATLPQINSWWLYLLMDPNRPPTAFHKITVFLHTCVTVNYETVADPTMWFYHLLLLMQHVDKSYKDLVRRVSVDNGMGVFLNLEQNVVGHPNENYARELLELFTVGKGPQIGPGNYTNYTEDDIREAARLLTGFRLNRDYNNASKRDPVTNQPLMQPSTSRHDSGNKQFSAAFQNRVIQGRSTAAGMLEEMDELIDMIFDQEAVSRFIMRKLYRYFVNYRITPEVETDIITPLAEEFRSNGYMLLPVLGILLQSEHFYDEDSSMTGDETIGALIKNPLELWMQTMRLFECYIPDMNTQRSAIYGWLHPWQYYLFELGMDVFGPPSVAGYEPMYQEPDFNRYWLTATTLPLRYNYMYGRVLNANNTNPIPFGRFNMLDFVQNPENLPPYPGPDPMGNPGPHEGARIADYLVRTLVQYMFPITPDEDRIDYFKTILLDGLSPINWMFEWDAYRNTGNANNIRPQLNKLFKALVQAPEYQMG
ncbi:MAG: hypothetical protein OHK0039_38870 [Bacteroidia bacterium]